MGSCRCALPEEGTTGNPSSVRAVEMQRGQEGRRPGVTRSPGLLLLQYPWLGDNRALHEMTINQKISEGAQAAGRQQRAVLSFSAAGCHRQGEHEAQGGSAVLPALQGVGLSSPFANQVTLRPHGTISAYCMSQQLGYPMQINLRGPPCSQL